METIITIILLWLATGLIGFSVFMIEIMMKNNNNPSMPKAMLILRLTDKKLVQFLLFMMLTGLFGLVISIISINKYLNK